MMVVKMKCLVCVALIIACAGLSEATLVSWDGYSSDIVGLAGNNNSTPNSWDTLDSAWGTTDEVVSAVGSQASFKAAIGILPGQRRIAQINAGSDQIFVGGNELATGDPPPTSPYTTLVGFDTSAFGVGEVLTGISIEVRTRPTGDTMSLRWFVEAGGSTYVSGVVDSMTGAEYKTLTLSDATAIEWFAFDKNADIGSAVGASVGTLSLTDINYAGYYTSSSFTTNANWHGAFVKTFSVEASGPNPYARQPDPADGANVPPSGKDDDDSIYMIMTFDPGDDAISHTAYFSDNYDDVANRVAGANIGAPPFPALPTTYYAGLDDANLPDNARAEIFAGTTYYWAVDESNGVEDFPGAVWSFRIIPEQAWNPDPEDGASAVNADPNVTVSWELGSIDTSGGALSFKVYYGTVEQDVEDGTSDSVEVDGSATSVEIGPLSPDTTIYWRVATIVTEQMPPFLQTIVEGDTWEFTTLPAVPITDPNLKVWLKLDDGAGDLAFDSSGHANHGTLIGGPQWIIGYEGGALDFAGTSSSVNLDGYKGVNAIAGTQQPFTVANWFMTTGNGEMVTWGTNSGGQRLSWRLDGGRLRTEHGSGNLRGNTYVNDGEWHHGALVVEEGANLRVPNTRLYVDGAQDTVFSGSDNAYNLTANVDVSVGRRATSNDRFFPGAMDDVRIYNKVLSDKEIKILAGLLKAFNPNPANNATDVPGNVALSWTPGVFASASNGNVLYYSEDQGAVIGRTAPSVTLTTPSSALPSTLDLGTSFYWAVDTVNGVDVWPGDVWTFTTINWLSVDDMEIYTPWTMPGNNIFEAWRDGEGDCTLGNGNQTGSTLTENMDMAFVLDGLQSMKYDYDNDGLVYSPCTMSQAPRAYLYSKIEAQVAGLASGIGTNWTIEGVKALQINFMGQAGNSTTEPLWVQLQDSSKTYGDKVFYGDYAGEDVEDLNDASWHQWNIDLADFNVDLTNVVSIVIGIGNEGSAVPGGSGTLYLDEIRLYVPRCVPSRSSEAFAKVDLNSDCTIDFGDLDVLFDEWLFPRDEILAPGDFIIAIDADGDSGSPAAEQVHEAIDLITSGGGQKYLNQGGVNSGFIVTPASGASIATSFVIWTANDTVGRDPATWTLYGTNDPIVSANHSTGTDENWTEIASGSVSLPDARNVQGPLVSFANGTSYTSYKMLFPTLKAAEPLMQIAEIQFRSGTPTNFEDYAELLKVWLDAEDWPN